MKDFLLWFLMCGITIKLAANANPLMVRTVCQIDECVAKAKDSSDPTVSSCDKADQDSGQDSFRDINFRFASSHAVSDVQKEVPCEGCNFVTRCDAESSTPGGSALDGNPLVSPVNTRIYPT